MKSNDPGDLSEYSEIVAQISSSEPGDTYNSSIKKSGLIKSLSFIISIVLPLTCLAQYEKEPGLYTPDSSLVIEKVYLQTDRDYYTQGDIIWFKAYLVEDPDLSLSYNSMNLHVELISSRSEIIDSRIIRIEGGLGNGDIRLSDTLSPGVYIIRAYTNYMRNFADMQIFEKALIIFSSSGQEAVRSDSYIKPFVSYNVNFFPEGGSLVNNVTCSVLFKTVDETGKGCAVSGEVYTSSGERVALFRTAYKGMGRFYMRPVDGLSYYAMIKTPDGNTIRKDLPQSFTNGLTLNVSDYKENGPLITIRTNPATLASLTDQVHFITVSAHKRVISTLGFSINSLSTNFRLPLDDLPDGIVQLTLINSDGLPLCERLIFHSKENLKLEVTTDKPIYKKREKVSVKLALRSDSVINDNTFLSISAVETSFLINNRWSNPTISSWFLLESDIRGPAEDPAYYFDPSNADRIKNLDLLLCTQGWRDFKWKYENQVFRPEYGITISGRVTKLMTENPMQNAVVTAILRKEKNELMLTSATDSTGLFSFDEVDFTGDARIIATAVSEKDSPAGHLIIDTTGYIPEPVVNEISRSGFLLAGDLISEEEKSETEHEFIIRNNKDVKLMLSDTIQIGEVKIVARRNNAAPDYQTQTAYAVQRVAVGIPDVIIKVTPQDERFTNFRDIIRKGVSGVRVETTNDVSESGIRIRGSSLEPLFMLDGITVPYDMIATFPIKWIDRIEVLKSGGIATTLTSMDAPKYNGVISIITKPEEKRDEKMPRFHSVNMLVKGYDVPRIFYSPDYSVISESAYLPDHRSTLFWDPDVTIIDIGTIDYYNADNKGNVMIVVEGITSDGIPVTGSVKYEVR